MDFTKHTFKDEWLARALVEHDILEKDLLSQLRQQYATAELLQDVLIQNGFFQKKILWRLLPKCLKCRLLI